MSCVHSSFDNGLLTITLDRPEGHNSLNQAARLELAQAFSDAAAACDTDDDAARVRAVLFTGGAKVFCVGQDLKEHLGDLKSGSGMSKVDDEYNPMVAALLSIPVPVVAAVNGAAAGAGWSLALNCDFRVAAESASFKAAFPSIGLANDCGMSRLLPDHVGRAKALELLFADKPIGARQALELGLVTEVVDGDDATAAATECARRLADGPTCSYREIKALVRDAEAINAIARLESGAQTRLAATADHQEALQAFMEKRAPTFIGR
ncbi:enoyl-CoA hydratase/isomerase family protein [Corynebacterium sp. TAE3-ERU12]|uniref:enoyl-CoA hydratase-related protein n=1 Tax=Corynebacterium sp. TAE3-ERU12 TaxID=2849491 RepID=UPI001C4395D0|nr:enoyl-CoA hydratase-related protein [Corynebacterium sp. TAE3-ERU12]MBV7295706.1 enoyl-CoA hydratase/isomerase family protein [Corynebacterium sp. TAE3-ERU12]